MGTEPGDAARGGYGDQQPDSQQNPVDDVVTSQPAGTPQDQKEEEKSQADRYLSNWQRAEADLANLRRRNEQDRIELARFANASLIGKLLPVLDDFERAVEAVPEKERRSPWVEGIRLIDRKLRNVLESEGVTAIDALGKEFDPYVHEAVMREDGEGNTDVVVQELQKGYKLHDRVIRPTMVKVGRGNATSDSGKKEK